MRATRPRLVLKLFLIFGFIFLVGSCDESGSEETGRYEITSVEVEQLDSGVYEVTFDAEWEGELSAQESSCIVQVFGADNALLAKGREKVAGPGTGLTTTVDGDDGTAERAELLCPHVARLDLEQ